MMGQLSRQTAHYDSQLPTLSLTVVWSETIEEKMNINPVAINYVYQVPVSVADRTVPYTY